jgi:hypothetical protein
LLLPTVLPVISTSTPGDSTMCAPGQLSSLSHSAEHPSPVTTLPSSQVSPWSSCELPQVELPAAPASPPLAVPPTDAPELPAPPPSPP